MSTPQQEWSTHRPVLERAAQKGLVDPQRAMKAWNILAGDDPAALRECRRLLGVLATQREFRAKQISPPEAMAK